jgi:hypothetical protein
MLQRSHILRRQYQARAASVEMDVQTVLTRIGAAAVSVVIVMVAGTAVIVIAVVVVVRVVMMVTMVIMAGFIVRVGMHKGSREGTRWSRKSHAQGWRERKQPRHHPDQGNASSASSLHARQHVAHFTRVSMMSRRFAAPLTFRAAALLRRYPLYPFRMFYHNLT